MTGKQPTTTIQRLREHVKPHVRKLVWTQTGYGVWTADTPFCVYTVIDTNSGNGWQWTRSEYPYPEPDEVVHATPDDAKLAAEADYVMRILSALDEPH